MIGADHRVPSRRGLLTGAGGLVALAAATPAAQAAERPALTVAFRGDHQAGITTPQQTHTYFMTFDLTASKPTEVADLLRVWTEVTARLTEGQTAAPASNRPDGPATDSAEALGLGPERLTLTFGIGAGLFSKEGVDRYGLAARRPQALIDLPRFDGDQLVPEATGGDLFGIALTPDGKGFYYVEDDMNTLVEAR